MTEYGAREERSDRFTALEEQFEGYEVYDQNGEKIGKVDDLFVDENDQPEYIGVKMGLLGMSSTLIPWQLATEDEANRRIDVSVDKETAKNGPAFDDDREITPETTRTRSTPTTGCRPRRAPASGVLTAITTVMGTRV